ncbi:MAG TPA: exonuclease domain-containing protein [Candidatus Faecousia intestinavium]|nr:exonuclease domain-containing protein [Candidatus Faecousia gallistercoris]HIT36091.1 exonuclease domain-containing protein [Candidatus Faecousia intestinavium]
MDYIVLDMEWNQPWPGSPSAKKVLPVAIRGEIIQIGAVRVTQDQQVADEFQILIKPKYYRHLNRRVSKLTGIKEARLREEGVPFPEAMETFVRWCGEDVIFLTWGFDDIGILRENLELFGIDTDFTQRWYNAQMIFNAQTDGSNAQKALKTAMEMFSIEPSRPAHDALGDAYHTALICARLDLPKGIAEYEQALKSHENGFHGAELPGCIARKVFYDYADKRAALGAMAGEENKCPICGARMLGSRWFAQPGHRYMDLATCPEHGKFLIRVRLSLQPDGLIRVSRLTYEATSEAAQVYARRAEKADPEDGSRTRRRRRRRSASRPESSGEESG